MHKIIKRINKKIQFNIKIKISSNMNLSIGNHLILFLSLKFINTALLKFQIIIN